MLERPPDIAALAKALAEQELRYVLVGGMAVVFYGGAAVTQDYDLAISTDPENRRRLVAALAPFNPHPLRSPKGSQYVWDELSVRSPWTILDTDLGRIDLLVQLPGLDSFTGLYERAVITEVDGIPLRIAAIDDLIAMKRASDRQGDRLHVEMLLEAKKRSEQS